MSIPTYFSCSNRCFNINAKEGAQISAFSSVPTEEKPKSSFIVIREKPCMVKSSSVENSRQEIAADIPEAHKNEHEDSDSTHHSHTSPKMQKKLSKEEKRKVSLKSIMRLIDSRKADTFQELDKYGDDDLVLKRSPKPVSKNTKLSHYRGVSHNGRKWQVMIMGFAKKIYFGGISTEDEASHKYDKYAILMHGLEVRSIQKVHI